MKISRSRLQRFLDCPKCEWLNYRGIKHPEGFPFTINTQVDKALKIARIKNNLLKRDTPYRLKANYKGHEIYGLPDDILVVRHDFNGFMKNEMLDLTGGNFIGKFKANERILIDYKATGATGKPMKYDSMKNQLDFYWYIMSKMYRHVSKHAFWYYVEFKADVNIILSHKRRMIHYIPNPTWVEDALDDLIDTLEDEYPPESSKECKYCKYVESRRLSLYKETNK